MEWWTLHNQQRDSAGGKVSELVRGRNGATGEAASSHCAIPPHTDCPRARSLQPTLQILAAAASICPPTSTATQPLAAAPTSAASQPNASKAAAVATVAAAAPQPQVPRVVHASQPATSLPCSADE